jgi:hypothetical protein
MCLRTKSESRIGAETTIIFFQEYTGDTNKRPTTKFLSEGKSIVEYKLGKIAKI